MIVRISLFVIAALFIGAHYFRAGNYWLFGLCLASPLLFLYKRRLSLVLLQLGAYWASAVWVMAALELVQMRQQIGRPWTTAAIILGSVAVLTLLAGLLLNSRCMREPYSSSSSP